MDALRFVEIPVDALRFVEVLADAPKFVEVLLDALRFGKVYADALEFVKIFVDAPIFAEIRVNALRFVEFFVDALDFLNRDQLSLCSFSIVKFVKALESFYDPFLYLFRAKVFRFSVTIFESLILFSRLKLAFLVLSRHSHYF